MSRMRPEEDWVLRQLKSMPPIQFIFNAFGAALFAALTEQFNIALISGLASIWTGATVVFSFSPSSAFGYIYISVSFLFVFFGLAFFLGRIPELFECTIDACSGSKEGLFVVWFFSNYLALGINLITMLWVVSYVRIVQKPALPETRKTR